MISPRKYVHKTPYLKALIVGPSGCGKTFFLGSCPKLMVLECDRGLETLRNHTPLTYTLRYNPGEQKFYANDEVVQSPYSFTLDIIRGLARKSPPFDKKENYPETFAIDSLTFLGTYLEREINTEKMKWEQYPLHKAHILNILDLVKELPMNVIVTSSLVPAYKKESDAKGNVIESLDQWHPDLAGSKTGPLVPRYFNETYIFSCERSTPDDRKELPNCPRHVYVLRTKPYNNFIQAKSTLGLPDRILFPTYEKLIALWQKKGKQDENSNK